MDYIIKDKRLPLEYIPGKGAWTYHIKIPNTKEIDGKWGDLKVSGYIDNVPLEARNLAPVKGADKMLSINETIRRAIKKTGGDMVTVTLYLINRKEQINKAGIIRSFKDAAVYDRFLQRRKGDQTEIIKEILAAPTEERQLNKIVFYIDQLEK